MTDAIIKAVVKSVYRGDASDRPDIIASKLNAVRKLEELVTYVMARIEEEEERHEAALEALDSELRGIRERCGHESKTYHGDPSGGSDSHHSCNICGAEL